MVNREVTIISLSFQNQPTEKIMDLVKAEAEKGCDMILLPEMWTGETPETLEDGTTAPLRKIAKAYGVYIVNAVYLSSKEHPRSNSAVLIGRDGNILGIYNKMYPYWEEYDLKPDVYIGRDAPVFETDFGRVGIAICFDVNFNDVWQRLAEKRADLVLWPSAYSAGTSLQAHALNYHFAIVSSTLMGDCVAYDINGEEIFYQKGAQGEVLVSRVTLNTNRAIFHENFNLSAKDKLLRDDRKAVVLEREMPREQWFILKGINGAQVKALAREYGLEELPEYKRRSRYAIDQMRAKQAEAAASDR